MNTSSTETERINFALTAPIIKALRMLAVLTGKSQNQVAEDLLIKGGLHNAVESAWTAGKLVPAPSIKQAPQTPPEPQRAAPLPPGWMPLVPKPEAKSAGSSSIDNVSYEVDPSSKAVALETSRTAPTRSNVMAAPVPRVEPINAPGTQRAPSKPIHPKDDDDVPW